MPEIVFPSSTLAGAPPRPYLTLEIENKFPSSDSKKLPMLCLLDTGADWNMLSAYVCDVLGHNLEDGSGPYSYSGVGNKSRNAYRHSNRIKIFGPSGDPVFTGEMHFFISEEWDSGCGILGHNDFFLRFPAFFDTERNYFTLLIE